MSTHTTAVLGAKPAVSTFSPSAVVQRKCGCGGSAGLSGECEECAAKRLVGSVQPKLVVGRPNDRYEQEAELVSRRVLQAESLGLQPGPEANEVVEEAEKLTQLKADRVQRQEEEEEPAPVDEEAGTLYVTSAEEKEEYAQAKAAPGVKRRATGPTSEQFESDVARRRGRGSSLPDELRDKMERAFGADFRNVRIHDDSSADRLTRSIHALAFTTGTDIYFRPSEFHPGDRAGRLLLAHELTHVVQQNPTLRVPTAPPLADPVPVRHRTAPTVQKADGEEEEEEEEEGIDFFPIFGNVVLLDESGNRLHPGDGQFAREDADPLPPDRYEYKIRREGSGYVVNVRGKDYKLTQYPDKLGEVLPRIAQAWLDVPAGAIDPDEEGKTAGGGNEVEGEPGAPGTPSEEPKEEPGEPPPAGSKYGVFALVDYPPEVIAFLEGVIETLGDAPEIEELAELLRALRDLESYQAELERIFTDTDSLLRVALGIDESEGVEKLAEWAKKPVPKTKKRVSKASRKGIAGLSQGVVAMISALRRVLRPVFETRARVQQIFGTVAALVYETDGIEDIFDLRADQASDQFKEALAGYTPKLAAGIQTKIDSLRELLKIDTEEIKALVPITYEDLGRAVTRALVKSIPKHMQLVVGGVEKLGINIQTFVADEFIAKHLIPKEVLDSVNGLITGLLEKFADAEFVKSLEADLDKILLGAGAALEKDLVPVIENALLQLDPAIPGSMPSSEALHALGGLRGSEARPLPGDLKDELQPAYNFDLSSVRVVNDSGAHASASALGANAFTIGKNIVFGDGRFDSATPEGRRILAHELTHVGQQQDRPSPAGDGSIQCTYEDVLADIVAKFGDHVAKSIEDLKGAALDPLLKKKAEDILNKINSDLIDKPVKSKTNPDVRKKTKQAYTYELDTKSKPVKIRRKTKWLTLLPALHIADKSAAGALPPTGATGYIKWGHKALIDRHAKDRAKLRSNLMCMKNHQAHHVIPLQERSHVIVDEAERNKPKDWFNDKGNGECLGPKTHRGSHPKYTLFVRDRLGALLLQHPTATWSPGLATDFDALMVCLHAVVVHLNNKTETIEDAASVAPGLKQCPVLTPVTPVAKSADAHSAPTNDDLPTSMESDINRRRGEGKPLREETQARMGELLGADLAPVRVHTGPAADRLSSSLHARAFTSGTDIYFRTAAYQPDSPSGEQLLAHELTHTVQQTQSLRSGAVPGVQRNGDEEATGNKPKQDVGQMILLDADGEELEAPGGTFQHHRNLGLGPGAYDYPLRQEGGKWKVTLQGEEIGVTVPPGFKKIFPRIARMVLVIGGTPGEGQKQEGAGDGGAAAQEQTGTKSKYGVFGTLNLPDWVARELEAIVDALGNEEEAKQLVELVRMLRDIAPHLEELNRVFGSSDALLGVALGIDESKSFAAIEAWVTRHTAEKRKPGKHKGIAGVVAKIGNLTGKVKTILGPVFAARRKVESVFGQVTGLVFAVDGLDQLFDMRADQASDEFKELVEAYSANLSSNIQEKLDALRGALKLQTATFEASEMITAEEVGRALYPLVKQLAPKPVQMVLTGLDKVGVTAVERALADHVLAELIPPSAIDAINEKLASALAKLSAEFIGAVEADLDRLLLSAGSELETALVPAIKDALLQLDPATPGVVPPPSKVASSLVRLSASSGRTLPVAERESLRGQYGFDLASVRIFDDSRSHAAATALGANAFTFRRNIYFGQNRYQPHTAEGRRILAHELTHVEQQSGTVDPSLVQPDYQSVLIKLVAKFGEQVKKSLVKIKGRRSDPKLTAEAKAIEKKVTPLIGEAVFSSQRPDIATTSSNAYRYAIGGGGKPVGVRRHSKWLGLLPAIHIGKRPTEGKRRQRGAVGYLSYGFLRAFDPKAADRRELRRALNNCTDFKEAEAHHLVPLQLRNHEVMKLAAKNGFGFNTSRNGLCLGPRTHKGSHSKYTSQVRAMLDSLLVQHPDLDWKTMRKDFEARMARLRASVLELNSRRKKIDKLGPIK